MMVRTIEFSGYDLTKFNKTQLIDCLDANPHLIESYKVFLKAMRPDSFTPPALVVKTADLTEEQHRILAAVIGLATGLLVFETPS